MISCTALRCIHNVFYNNAGKWNTWTFHYADGAPNFALDWFTCFSTDKAAQEQLRCN